MAENEKKREEARAEVEELKQRIEENQRIEAEKNRKIHARHAQHQSDLLGQMDYNRRQRALADTELEREWKVQNAAELEYQRKLQDALERPDVDRLHPMRRARPRSQITSILG